MPARKPSITTILPIGAHIEFAMFRFNPILVSIKDAEKIVIVEIIAETSKVVNDRLDSKAITEYPNNGIGINKMKSTAKNTPIADEEL